MRKTSLMPNFTEDPMYEIDLQDMKTIYDVYERQLAIQIEDYCNRKKRLHAALVPVTILLRIIIELTEQAKQLPIIIQLTSPITIVGDLHGHLPDLLKIIQMNGSPGTKKYLFLGDTINQGQFSLETLSLILVMKILWPENVFLIRGSAEFRDVCKVEGFFREIISSYDNQRLIIPFTQLFANLPIAATIDNKFFCVNGGIGPNIPDLDAIGAIRKPIHTFNSLPLIELLLSDPTDALPMFLPISRGLGNLFGNEATEKFLKTTKFSMIIRSHSVVEEGFKIMFNDRLISVFSASKFCNQSKNSGGYVVINNGQPQCFSFPPLEFLTRDDVLTIPSTSETSYVLPSQVSFLNPLTPIRRCSQTMQRIPIKNEMPISNTSSFHASSRNFQQSPARRGSLSTRTASKMVLNF